MSQVQCPELSDADSIHSVMLNNCITTVYFTALVEEDDEEEFQDDDNAIYQGLDSVSYESIGKYAPNKKLRESVRETKKRMLWCEQPKVNSQFRTGLHPAADAKNNNCVWSMCIL